MPSKEVLSAAAHRFQARHDDRLVGDLPEVDLDAVVERKDDHTLDWAATAGAGSRNWPSTTTSSLSTTPPGSSTTGPSRSVTARSRPTTSSLPPARS